MFTARYELNLQVTRINLNPCGMDVAYRPVSLDLNNIILVYLVISDMNKGL